MLNCGKEQLTITRIKRGKFRQLSFHFWCSLNTFENRLTNLYQTEVGV